MVFGVIFCWVNFGFFNVCFFLFFFPGRKDLKTFDTVLLLSLSLWTCSKVLFVHIAGSLFQHICAWTGLTLYFEGFIVHRVVLFRALGLQLQCFEVSAVPGGGSLLDWVGSGCRSARSWRAGIHREQICASGPGIKWFSKLAVKVLLSAEVYSEHTDKCTEITVVWENSWNAKKPDLVFERKLVCGWIAFQLENGEKEG